MTTIEATTTHLIVSDAAAASAWYQRAFDAHELNRVTLPDGRLIHVEVHIGPVALMLADEFPEHGALGPQGDAVLTNVFYLHTDDVDALWQRAIDAGATATRPLTDVFWGEREGQLRDIPRSRVLKDDVIADIAVHAPTTLEKLKHLRSLPKGFERSRWGEAIVAAVARGLERDPKTLPRPARMPQSANGLASVELLKVLLRMISERHHVAAKVIATVDDLERIAGDDHADVAALSGWRRELFGEKALALKHGKLALAIEKGKVAAVERG